MGNADKDEKMKAAIYNPYFKTLGGGERYTASFVKVLLEKDFEVDIEWKGGLLIKEIKDRFDIDLQGARVVKSIKRGDGYDLCFWISDGSIPLLKSRKNILLFQEPFHDVKGDTLINKMKFARIDASICYSNFVKKIIDKEYKIESKIIPPAVSVDIFKPRKKENVILYVGRFSILKQSKNQDVLIKAFKRMCDKGLKGWRLILAGGTEVGVGGYIDKLEKMSKDYPIELVKSPSLSTLKSLYGKAKIFWSAAGYGVNDKKEPEKMEHFGITPIEAMAAGCIPVVFNGGGHREIVKESENGFLWDTTKDLIKKTLKLVNDKDLFNKLSLDVVDSSKKYGYEKFKKQILDIIK